MIIVLATITLNEGCNDEFLQIFKNNVPAVLKEDGCIEYMPTIDFNTEIPIQVKDSNIVTIIEKWESIEHLKKHFTAPHMLEYKAKVADLVQRVSLKVLTET